MAAKINIQNQGFTIVELLIVVVVIAILAAITIVSYNGITNRANASAAKSTATTVQKKIELYHAEQGIYPLGASALSNNTSKSYYLSPSSFGGVSDPTANDAGTKGTSYVRLQICQNAAGTPTIVNVTGTRITYYDYEKTGTDKRAYINLGDNCDITANLSDMIE